MWNPNQSQIQAKIIEIPIEPQEGPQTEFLRNEADIIIFGGSAGSGKTFGVLLDTLWFHDVPKYTSIIFRRNSTQIRAPGGLWQGSQELFREFEGVPRESTLEWRFPSGALMKFAHLEYEKDVYAYQGTELCGIYWDELTHFTRAQFFYMLSRNRSTCGVKPYIKATTNPDANSWVREMIDWWVNPQTGLAIPERSGVIRWFVVVNDKMIWADEKEELIEKYPMIPPKSFTFISSSIYDNKKLLEIDPDYLANLHALPTVERERLLNGNWNIKPSAGLYFQRHYFEFVRAAPRNTKAVRYWDRASTRKNDTNDPDYTVGLLLEKDRDGYFYVSDMVRIQESPREVQRAILNTAEYDGQSVQIGIEQDPGQAGVFEAEYIARLLKGYNVRLNKVSHDKITRANPVSAQAEAGNIKIVTGHWNEDFIKELENFPDAPHDDIVDALSGAFAMLATPKYNFSAINS